MRQLLDPVSDVSSKHISEGEVFHHIAYKELVERYPEITEYRKFVVMRDPCERFRSLFFHHIKNINGVVRRVNKVSPPIARMLFALLRCIRKGSLTSEVKHYTKGARFRVFALEDPRLCDRLQDFLTLELGQLPHVNAIDFSANGNLKGYERAIVRFLYRYDCALYQKVLRDGSADLDA